jgi:hypothetical protein
MKNEVAYWRLMQITFWGFEPAAEPKTGLAEREDSGGGGGEDGGSGCGGGGCGGDGGGDGGGISTNPTQSRKPVLHLI